MCRHVDFVAVSRHAISHSTHCATVPVTGVSKDGREWDGICGSGAESGQTNQLAD